MTKLQKALEGLRTNCRNILKNLDLVIVMVNKQYIQ